MSAMGEESVLEVRHWTDTLFSFKTTRDPSFRFVSGQFTMIGLEVNARPLLRAYSIASAPYDDHLEFLSIKVADGPLTSRLQHIRAGDRILIGRKPTGTLLIHDLLPGRTLFLLATGTGLAPFMSIIRDPDTYSRFDKVVLVHGCRMIAELAYCDVIKALPEHPIFEDIDDRLLYYPIVSREPFRNRGRITELLTSERFFAELGIAPLDAEHDRVLMCGNEGLITDVRDILESSGFDEAAHNRLGRFAVEKAFVQR
jgi:ferredoxin--NADP+ reductase